MISYRKKGKFVKKNVKKYLLSEFLGLRQGKENSTLPANYTDKCFNFTMQDSRLKEGYGVKKLKSVDGDDYEPTQYTIERIYAYPSNKRNERELVLSAEDVIYRLKESEKYWQFQNLFPSHEEGALTTVDERPVLLIPKKNKGIYIYDGFNFSDAEVNIAPTAMCSHYGRVFAVDKNDEYRLIFSDVGDPTNWNVSLDEGGRIYMDVEDGRILKLISHGGHLYIFREYSIYRLTAYGDQRDFVMKKVANTTAKVWKDTVALCDNRIIFLTRAGAYQFDGYNVGEIMKGYSSYLTGIVGKPFGSFFNGKYYLALKNKYSDGKNSVEGSDNVSNDDINDTLLTYDTQSGDVSLSSNVYIKNMQPLRSRDGEECLLAVGYSLYYLGYVDKGSGFFERPVEKIWESPRIDFLSSGEEKEIDGISVPEGGSYVFGISADGSIRRDYQVDGRKKYIPIGIRGKSFVFTIRAKSGSKDILSPYVYVKS